MQTHRFVQIDDLATGQTFVRELMAGDAARIYSTEEQAQLARGETIRLGDKLHCDLQAFLRINRHLPDCMTRPPRAAVVGHSRSPVVAISVATDQDVLDDLWVIIPQPAAQRLAGFGGVR